MKSIHDVPCALSGVHRSELVWWFENGELRRRQLRTGCLLLLEVDPSNKLLQLLKLHLVEHCSFAIEPGTVSISSMQPSCDNE